MRIWESSRGYCIATVSVAVDVALVDTGAVADVVGIATVAVAVAVVDTGAVADAVAGIATALAPAPH